MSFSLGPSFKQLFGFSQKESLLRLLAFSTFHLPPLVRVLGWVPQTPDRLPQNTLDISRRKVL